MLVDCHTFYFSICSKSRFARVHITTTHKCTYIELSFFLHSCIKCSFSCEKWKETKSKCEISLIMLFLATITNQSFRSIPTKEWWNMKPIFLLINSSQINWVKSQRKKFLEYVAKKKKEKVQILFNLLPSEKRKNEILNLQICKHIFDI